MEHTSRWPHNAKLDILFMVMVIEAFSEQNRRCMGHCFPLHARGSLCYSERRGFSSQSTPHSSAGHKEALMPACKISLLHTPSLFLKRALSVIIMRFSFSPLCAIGCKIFFTRACLRNFTAADTARMLYFLLSATPPATGYGADNFSILP